MGINISQFSPPATVSNLVWDDDMTAGAGKIFKGDLTGNVTGDLTGDVTGDVAGNITGTIQGNNAVGYLLPQTGGIKIFDTVTALQSGHGTTYSDLSPVITPIVIFGAIVPTKIKLALTYNTAVYESNRNYTTGGIQSIASDGISVIETVNIPDASAPGNYTVTLNTAGVAYVRTFSHFASPGTPADSQVTTTLLDSFVEW